MEDWRNPKYPPVVQTTRSKRRILVPRHYDYRRVREVADAHPGRWVVAARRTSYALARRLIAGEIKSFGDSQDYEIVRDKPPQYHQTDRVDVYVRRRVNE